MNVLLTGATGFVGRNYLIRAVGRRWKVFAPVRDAKKLHDQVAAEGLDPSLVEALPASPESWPGRLSLDAAIHCAGALFERSLESYLRTNVAWTQSVLAKLPAGCPTIVLSSQSAGGPTPAGKSSRSESDADDPVSEYGESKLRMERAIFRSGRRHTVILRPPMILGPRDSAQLQLFEMARGPLRTKPGFKKKFYSFIACEDLLNALDAGMEHLTVLAGRTFFVASPQVFSDIDLLNASAACLSARGMNLPLPHAAIRIVSAVVDASPALRTKLPSLGRDRVREILEDRWVVNASRFCEETGWQATKSLALTLEDACTCYRSAGLLK
jgi:nucleoside-diphosphate-sugar epimerase